MSTFRNSVLNSVLGLVMIAGASAHAASSPAAAAGAAANPFAAESTLPYQMPDFAHIKDADFAPALEQGMANQRREVRVIAQNKEPPTFENTIVALERSGRELNRAADVF